MIDEIDDNNNELSDENDQQIDENPIILTDREIEILSYVLDGKTSSEVAAILGRSKRTIDFHLSNIYTKLEVKNRVQAIRAAASLGLFNIK
jgi:DNA-binding CsgD family transcriptional regulator